MATTVKKINEKPIMRSLRFADNNTPERRGHEVGWPQLIHMNGDLGGDLNPAAGCDIETLPEANRWPMPPISRAIADRYLAMGIIDDPILHAAFSEVERDDYLLNPPPGVPNTLGRTALTLPWHPDAAASGALIPSHFEVAQVMSALGIISGERILLIGPRGLWIANLMEIMGVSEILVIDPIEERIPYLEERNDGEIIQIGGLAELSLALDGELWDRILITLSLKEAPHQVLRSCRIGGRVIMPIQEKKGEAIPQFAVFDILGDGYAERESRGLWNADLAPFNLGLVLGCPDQETEIPVIEEEANPLMAWMVCGSDPIRDRFGPRARLWHLLSVWDIDSIERNESSDSLEEDVRRSLADDLHRFGTLLAEIGIHPMAVEHLGTSHMVSPSAEAATDLGAVLARMGEREEGKGWMKKALEYDPTLAETWAVVGGVMIDEGDIAGAIPWYAAAIQAPRSREKSTIWLGLARAHEELGQRTAAFLSAQRAIEEGGGNSEEALELLKRCGEGLV